MCVCFELHLKSADGTVNTTVKATQLKADDKTMKAKKSTPMTNHPTPLPNTAPVNRGQVPSVVSEEFAKKWGQT